MIIKNINRIIFFKNSQKKNIIFNKNLHYKSILLYYILMLSFDNIKNSQNMKLNLYIPLENYEILVILVFL